MTEIRERPVQSFCSFAVSFMCGLWRGMIAKVVRLAIYGYFGVPFTITYARHTLKTRSVRIPMRYIATIFRSCGFAKITPSIIGSIFIAMVYFARRPNTRHHLPNYPMRSQQQRIYSDQDVAVTSTSCYSACRLAASIHSPVQHTRIRIILEKFTETFSSWQHRPQVTIASDVIQMCNP